MICHFFVNVVIRLECFGRFGQSGQPDENLKGFKNPIKPKSSKFWGTGIEFVQNTG